MGGKGNFKFKSSTNQAPRRFQQGIKGQEMWVWLRLKLIADIGFVGVPTLANPLFCLYFQMLSQRSQITLLRL